MLDKAIIRNYSFDVSDDTIHSFAPIILLSKQDSEFWLTQGKYTYRVRGGRGGYLYYKKGVGHNWISIANWCFYGLYIVVRYRKPTWLRPMYRSLFTEMNFASVTFHEHSIKLAGRDGEILRSKRFRLSPSSALERVMTEKFGYTCEQVEALKTEIAI